MRILCVSDYVVPELQTAGTHQRLAPVDLVISCGDLPPEYLSFLYTAFDVPLLYVRGNHDIRYHLKPPLGCSDIHTRIVRVAGTRILGLAGSRWYNGGPNQYTEAQMKRTIWKTRPAIWWSGGVDIVVSHAPPRHVHDAEDRCHRGFKCFHWLIDRYSPLYFIHGHLHRNFSDPGQRITRVGRTQVVNTCGYTFIEVDHG
jgi:Icc-related predicted phosphoesterase